MNRNAPAAGQDAPELLVWGFGYLLITVVPDDAGAGAIV